MPYNEAKMPSMVRTQLTSPQTSTSTSKSPLTSWVYAEEVLDDFPRRFTSHEHICEKPCGIFYRATLKTERVLTFVWTLTKFMKHLPECIHMSVKTVPSIERM